ncbi:MAG: HD domain-containing protein [Bacillales bacterium]
MPVFPFARDAVARAATSDEFCERLRNSEEAARLFRRLVRAVRRTRFRDGSVLAELHDVGLLVAMIPEFAPVVGRVHHDVYHVYTVDVHSIAAVDKLRALCRGELAQEHPLASRLAAEIARPQVLFMAALLHDVGHGPFSHSFEKVFHFDHEQFTKRIILEDTKINRVLKEADPTFPERVAAIIDKSYADKLVVSLISSQIDADRMDYLLRDAYYTGVSYGQFDMERILRVMRASENEIVIKYTGMHAVEDYILSRYQMYWQVYFHPVTRSAEVILTKIFHRVKHLYESGYKFALYPALLQSFFTDEVDLNDFLRLDESVIYYYFQHWQYEKDPILSDLSDRFVNRRLFKYVEYDPERHKEVKSRLEQLFQKAGIEPDYYLVIDSSKDLPYDVYRKDGEGRVPIYLEMPNGAKKELSDHSIIVESITGKTRKDHKLYFPLDLLQEKEHMPEVKEIQALLTEMKYGNGLPEMME